MNLEQTYKIKCPECETEQAVEVCQSIDARQNPTLREKLIHNDLNMVQCDNCEYKFRIDTPLLYTDPDKRIAIVCAPTVENVSEYDDQAFRKYIVDINPSLASEIDRIQIYLVLSHSELVEMVFIIEAGMDIRIVEYIKYLIYTRNADKVDPSQKQLLFNAQDSTDEKLLFIVQDVESRALEGVLEYSRQAYLAFEEMFDSDEYTPDLYELFPGPHISARNAWLEEIAPWGEQGQTEEPG